MSTANTYELHSEFDIEMHKKTFINYMEGIITEDGKIHYAVPSHQEFLIRYAYDKLGLSRKNLGEMCPPDYYLDYTTWLCRLTKSVAVWSCGYSPAAMNAVQRTSLNKLIRENLVKEHLL